MIHATATRASSPLPAAAPRRHAEAAPPGPAPAPLDAGRLARLGHRTTPPPAAPAPVQRQPDEETRPGLEPLNREERGRLAGYGATLGYGALTGTMMHAFHAPQGYQRGMMGIMRNLGAVRRAPRPVQVATAASTLGLAGLGMATGGGGVIRDRLSRMFGFGRGNR
jgi:hypothetical protein